MTLTNSDLSAIKKIVKGEIQGEVKPLKKGFGGVKNDVGELKGGFQEVSGGLKKLEKKIDKLDKKFDNLFNFLDKNLPQVKRRIDHIDGHLGINTSEL